MLTDMLGQKGKGLLVFAVALTLITMAAGGAMAQEEGDNGEGEAAAGDIGKEKYEQVCAACHGQDGSGLDAYQGQPDFGERSTWTSHTKSAFVSQVMKGGRIDGLGGGGGIEMPAQEAMFDNRDQVEATLAYAAQEFAGVDWDEEVPEVEGEEGQESSDDGVRYRPLTEAPGFSVLMAVAGLLAVGFFARRD